MHRFFAERVEGELAHLAPEDARHASRVLRLTAGDTVVLFSDGGLWQAELVSVSPEDVVARLTDQLPDTEPRLRITLYQGIPKSDKMDMICQKNTEIGVASIVPVAMKRCVSAISSKDAPHKIDRWQRICREAAKQSGRAVVPQVEEPLSFPAFLSRLSSHQLVLVPWEDASGCGMTAIHSRYPDVTDIAIVIGPEGGMEAAEVEAMNAVPITLGRRILRTETAGLVCAAGLLTLYGEME